MIQINNLQEAINYNANIDEITLSRVEALSGDSSCVLTYSKPHDEWQGREVNFANMTGGYPFECLGVKWPSVEHLYLCGEWSDGSVEHLNIQRDVLSAKSGYAAKRYKKEKYKKFIRKDFSQFRLQWMLWCVWQKCCLCDSFRNHLMSFPKETVIVELVKNDPVWAAWKDETGVIRGANGMGKVLTICKRCLEIGTAPQIDRELLNAFKIHVFGQKVEF